MAAFLFVLAFLAVIEPASSQSVLPQGPTVVTGSVNVGTPVNNGLTINQSSAHAIVNWNSFSIGRPNSVTFVQPGASSAILNRVTGSTPSSIAGQLNANGQVFLVNPNGISITSTGSVRVGGGFVASTLDIRNSDFMEGRLDFFGNGTSAAVNNAGRISTAPGGFVALLGGSVSNSGIISVPLGRVGLGSGERAALDLYGDGFLQVAVPTGSAINRALVNSSGRISAPGGRIELKAATVQQAVREAVNVSGIVSARSVSGHNGAIVLGGGAGGNVRVTGHIDVSGKKGAGRIEATGANVQMSNAKLSARSLKGKGGSIVITADNSIEFRASALDVSGGIGGGTVRIGGDFKGLGTIGTAATTVLDAATTIKADAIFERTRRLGRALVGAVHIVPRTNLGKGRCGNGQRRYRRSLI